MTAHHAALAHRRANLIDKLGGRPALLAAGGLVGRNYPANPYPFRASSHFLYFMGRQGAELHDSWLLFDDDGATLFTHGPDPDDALWHGPRPSLKELGEVLGLPVRDVSELDGAVKGRDLATLPAPDAGTRRRQSSLLGRDVSVVDEGRDGALADAVISLRLIHDEDAVEGLRAAADATVAAHLAGMRATRPGMREWEVCAAMEQELLARGMGTAYGSIVSVHGEVLHNHRHENVIADGDLLLCDVGAETQGGWAGDVTRTWPVSGKFTEEQGDIYEVVRQAQLAAIDACRPGTRYRDVHLTAARKLTEGLVSLGILSGDVDEMVHDGVHALFFPHGIGHLLGLDVHDMEDLGDRAGYAPGRTRSDRFGLCYLRLDRDLEPGMAVTIEPGFYQVPAILEDPARTAIADGRLNKERLAHFAGVRGIRIEDDILITRDGPVVLTQAAPKAPGVIEAIVGGGR